MAHKVTLVMTLLIEDELGEPVSTPPPYRWEKVFEGLVEQDPITAQVSSGVAILWDPVNWTGYPVSDFKLLVLVSDYDVELELTTQEGDANEELSHFTLKAGVPFPLGDDASRYNHSPSDAFAGTLGTINRIRVQETTGNTATVRGWLFT